MAGVPCVYLDLQVENELRALYLPIIFTCHDAAASTAFPVFCDMKNGGKTSHSLRTEREPAGLANKNASVRCLERRRVPIG